MILLIWLGIGYELIGAAMLIEALRHKEFREDWQKDPWLMRVGYCLLFLVVWPMLLVPPDGEF